MRARRAALAALLLVLTGCSGGTDEATPPLPTAPVIRPSPSQDPLAAFAAQTIDWQSCRDGAECGAVTVPVDYDDPRGPTIGIQLLRRPAADPDRRLGALLVNPGGPGASGLDYAAGGGVVTRAVAARYDIVGFDPRGTGRSDPIDCLDDAELDAWIAVDPTPDDEAETAALLASGEQLLAGCEADAGPRLPSLGTADVARDLDVVRAALGEERLHLLGKSYGTAIGAEYARQFPDRVGRFVLDGALDPASSGKEVSLGQAGGFQLAYERFAEACLATGCELGDTPEAVAQTLTSVLDGADRGEVAGADGPIPESVAFLGVAWSLYYPPEVGYPFLEAAVASAALGDGSLLEQSANGYLGRSPDGTFASNKNEVITVVNCLDRPGGGTVEDVEAARDRFAAASPLFADYFVWGAAGCPGWPVAADPLGSPVRAAGAPPILVVGTTGDPATPYEWSVALARQLASGVLLTFEGTPHTAYTNGSTCIDDAVDAFLVDGVVPPAGTRCAGPA